VKNTYTQKQTFNEICGLDYETVKLHAIHHFKLWKFTQLCSKISRV